jgi:hypothetical protein
MENVNIFCWNYADLAKANKHESIAIDLARAKVPPAGQTLMAATGRHRIPISRESGF